MSFLHTIHALAAAASEHGHGTLSAAEVMESFNRPRGAAGLSGWAEMALVIGSAVIFFGYIIYKVRPSVAGGLRLRRMKIEEQLAEAEKKAAEAEARAAEYKDKLAHLEEEVQRIADNYKAEAEREAKRMEEETEAAIARLARDSDNTIHQEILKAEQRIHEAAVQTTLAAAEQLLRERTTDADQRRLADQYIKQLNEERAPSA